MKYEKKRPTEWKGVLDTPLPTAIFLGNKEEGLKKLREAWDEREKALFAHYGLPYPFFMSLVPSAKTLIRELAIKIGIKGFQTEHEIEKLGRHKKWEGMKGVRLIWQVELAKLENPGLSTMEAIRIVARKKEYEEEKSASLYSRYQEIIKSNEGKGIMTMIEKAQRKFPKERQIAILREILASDKA